MSFEALQKLDKLQVSVDKREYENVLAGINRWQEADVLIQDKPDDNIRYWLHGEADKLGFQRIEAKRRAVVTRHAKALSWLFDQLRDIHPSEFERISDHDFYGMLADAANQFLEEKKAAATAGKLLDAVMGKAREIYR